jgi:exo-beta-1,3-glucanase (GH17 family)
MKAAFLATTAALMGSAVADVAHMRRHGHDSFHKRHGEVLSSSVIDAPGASATCGCTTEVITFYGTPTPVPVSTPEPEPTSSVTSQTVTTRSSTSTDTVTVSITPATPSNSPEPSSSAPAPSSSAPAPSTPPTSPSPSVTLPTPGVTSFTSTGVYTIPATTITVTDATTVCGATTTPLTSGTNTYGGVTTVVETATTVTCPVATVKPTGTTVTSVIEETTYVCPTAGTYTIAPTTTFVPTSTMTVYPTPQTITPGTYSHPEQTVTATRTDYTYVCPFTPANEPTSSPTPPQSTPSKSTPAATNTPDNTPTSTPVLGGGGDHMGVTYSPFSDDGGCKSKAQVLADIGLAKLKGFTHVRVYSTDCDTLENVGEACDINDLKMILGVFIDNTGIQDAKKQVDTICEWAQWEMVSLIVVGNEAIQSYGIDAGSLAGFIKSAKQQFVSSGYHGDVTTTEPINIWQQYGGTLCSAIDVLGANIHCFFNADTTAQECGKFVKGEIEVLHGICNKKVINLETGYPSKGQPNGKAVPSPENQEIAIRGIQEHAGDSSVFFSYSNEMWKTPGPWGVEQYWGCIQAF